jgi:uncharacterized damage-inducible protein DinB
MSIGISLEELLAWNDHAAGHWYEHLDTNRALLEAKCDVAGTANVQEFVRHIWSAELRWGQRLAALPVMSREAAPSGPLDTLFNLHRQAMEIFRNLIDAPARDWNEVYVVELDRVPEELRKPTRRKVAAHTLMHSHRHYAQLATLARQAGFPAPFGGDLLFSPVLR